METWTLKLLKDESISGSVYEYMYSMSNLLMNQLIDTAFMASLSVYLCKRSVKSVIVLKNSDRLVFFFFYGRFLQTN